MKIKSFLIYGFLFIYGISAALSQPREAIEAQNRIQTVKIAFFSKQLKLTTDEAKVFWPLYEKYMGVIEEQKMDRREKQDAVRERLEDMSEKQINELIDSRISQAELAFKARKEFVTELRKVLPPIKVAKYFKAEEMFQRELMERMREEREHERMRPERPDRFERRP